jgi:hypothetical protein
VLQCDRMDLQHIVTESELERHTSFFDFPLHAGQDEFKRQLHLPWIWDIKTLQSRQQDVQRLAMRPNLVEDLRNKLVSLQLAEQTVKEHKSSDTSKTADGQIFFTGSETKALNFIPWLLAAFVFFKVYLAPALALMMPLVLAVMPFVIMTTVMDMPIPWDVYVNMMKQMVFGIQSGEPWRPKHYVQALWTLASLGQGIVQPFFTAYHTAKLDATIVKRGEAFGQICSTGIQVLQTMRDIGCQVSLLEFPDVPTEPRQIAAWMEHEPLGVQTVWRILGALSIHVTLANTCTWHPVQWTSDKHTPLTLTNMSDIAIPSDRAVQSDISLPAHAILTGPNRGGKSSNLRAILQQIILGQRFGFTFQCQGTWAPFRHVFTRLKSKDHAGRESLFEMEVRMAATITRVLEQTQSNALVCIDELFHSTNPPDAEISARIFLRRLWRLGHVKSIISTHIFSLCEDATHSNIQTLCCPAEATPSGKILYTYKLASGICRVSSVKEVLEENGLLCA